jgi:hypothetical protein
MKESPPMTWEEMKKKLPGWDGYTAYEGNKLEDPEKEL